MRRPSIGSMTVAMKGAEIRPTTAPGKPSANQKLGGIVLAPRLFHSARPGAKPQQIARSVNLQS
ncbi:hypothetical protein [Pseudomonas fluorescens]|uniref:hypothetical protein n=1 Tax=Pseudomonas fluorescens TaxID=294 RepID=UPI0011CE4BED|nr:hypothetical protein [Pseudomonas fluorescens]